MNILHFYKHYKTDAFGGVAQVIAQLAAGCAQRGIESTVLALGREVGKSVEAGGLRLVRVRQDIDIASTPMALAAFRRFAELAEAADVVHYHFPWPFMDVVHFAVRPKKPTLVTYHSDIVKQKGLLKLYQPLQDCFLGDVDALVAEAPNYLATSTVLQKFAAKTVVIPIGIDRATYPQPSEAVLNRWRQKFGPRFFLFVGVLRYYKGLQFLLEAAKGSAYPIVIGGGGPLQAELKARAAALGLNRVHFTGFLTEEDKTALQMLSGCVVMPSHLRSEAFGISLLEGAMFGKPLISCEIGTGTSYINAHTQTGLVVPPADPKALREAMDALWNNPEQAETYGRNAAQRYRQLFTATRMVQAYVGLYEKLLKEHKHG